MEKENVLQTLRWALSEHIVSADEVANVMREVTPTYATETTGSSRSFATILAYIGAAIVTIGIVILLVQNWAVLGSGLRIVIGLGSALVALVTAMVFDQRADGTKIAESFYVIAGVIAPIGIAILFNESAITWTVSTQISVIAALLLALYGAIFFGYRNHTILIVLHMLYAVALVYALVESLVNPSLWRGDQIYHYVTMVIGAALICVGYGLRKGIHKKVTSTFYTFGAFAALFPGLFMGGVWDILYVVLVFVALFSSVHLKSRGLLVFGTLALMAYIARITGKYFANSIGWAFALVIIGLAFIAAAYLGYYLNKRYMRKQQLRA